MVSSLPPLCFHPRASFPPLLFLSSVLSLPLSALFFCILCVCLPLIACLIYSIFSLLRLFLCCCFLMMSIHIEPTLCRYMWMLAAANNGTLTLQFPAALLPYKANKACIKRNAKKADEDVSGVNFAQKVRRISSTHVVITRGSKQLEFALLTQSCHQCVNGFLIQFSVSCPLCLFSAIVSV